MQVFTVIGTLGASVFFLHNCLEDQIKENRHEIKRTQRGISRLEKQLTNVKAWIAFSGKVIYAKEDTEEQPKEN